MTKKQFQLFCIGQGWHAHFCGKTKAVYVNTGKDAMSADDIEIAVIQHFGFQPDYKLFKA
jgi:hypothetical protein